MDADGFKVPAPKNTSLEAMFERMEIKVVGKENDAQGSDDDV
jgi:hypothetical protein